MYVTRRLFLAGTASAAVLAACGSDGQTATTTTSAPAGGPDEGLSVIKFFDDATLVVGSEIRAPFGIADIDGPLAVDDSPAEMAFTVTNEAGEVASSTVGLRSDGLPRGYYPLRFVAPAAGLYDVAASADGLPSLETTIKVPESAAGIPGPGDPFPVMDTPTSDDARGVDPICTRKPICPLHDRNLPEILADGLPSLVIISTPEFCSTAVCGPVLDFVVAEAEARDGVSMLHAEVYATPATDLTKVAPIVTAMNLTFEPSAILIDANGAIVERLDFVFDASELREALQRLTA